MASLKITQKNRIFLVIIMLSSLTQLFSGAASANDKDDLYPRQIDLSGNVFHFAMPEDFSRDMPAYDMVEKLDISDLSKFDDPEYGNLIRRWWDIKEPGWFGKKLGTVMMDISVQRVVANKKALLHNGPFNIDDRLDFIMMLYDRYHQMYDSLNAEVAPERMHIDTYHSVFATVSHEEIYSIYRDLVSSGQKWMEYAVSAPAGQLIVNCAIPLTDQVFLEVSFTYSPNHGILPRELDRFATPLSDKIQKSFRISYVEGNPMAVIVREDWLESTNTELMNQHSEAILTLFYGPNPREALKRLIEESQKSYDSWLLENDRDGQ